MKHKLEIWRKILLLTYESLFTVLLAYFVEMILVKESPNPATIIIVPCMYIASYFIRDRAVNYGLIVMFHMLLAGIIALLPISIGLKGIIFTIVIYQIFEALFYARRGAMLRQVNDIPWPTFLACLVIYFYGQFTNSTEIMFVSNLIPILLLFVYLLMVYTEGLLRYIESTKDVSGIPLKNIISTNSFIVIAILGFLLVALLFGRILNLDRALIKLGAGIIIILKMLLYVVKYLLTMFGKLFSSGKNNNENFEIGGDQPVDYINTMNSFGEAILKLLIILLAIYIVYKIAAKIIKMLMASRTYSDDILEKAEVKRNSLSAQNIRKRIFKIRLSREEKARRYYRLRILRYKYDISLKRDKTCTELESEIAKQELGDVSEITALYSDIRYGNRAVDKNILREMNRLSRK